MLCPQSCEKSRRGFTLVEVIMVVGIIGILIAVILVVIDPARSRAKARDAQRIANLKIIQSAIELYKFDKGTYPQSSSWIAVRNDECDFLSRSLLSKNAACQNTNNTRYVGSMPFDSGYSTAPSSTPCSYMSSGTPNFRYNYLSNASGSFYLITAQAELTTSAQGYACSSLSQWGSSGCGVNANCVGFENKDL